MVRKTFVGPTTGVIDMDRVDITKAEPDQVRQFAPVSERVRQSRTFAHSMEMFDNLQQEVQHLKAVLNEKDARIAVLEMQLTSVQDVNASLATAAEFYKERRAVMDISIRNIYDMVSALIQRENEVQPQEGERENRDRISSDNNPRNSSSSLSVDDLERQLSIAPGEET